MKPSPAINIAWAKNDPVTIPLNCTFTGIVIGVNVVVVIDEGPTLTIPAVNTVVKASEPPPDTRLEM